MSGESDWMEALRAECARTSQAKVAGRLGYSGSVVSQVLKGAYPGSIERVEQAVRGLLMGGRVACPELGDVEGHVCLDHQKRARTHTPSNPFRVRMFRACRKCPRFTKEKTDEAL